MLLILWPIQAQEIPTIEGSAHEPVRFNTEAETRYLTDFAVRGKLEFQGLRIESLDGMTVLADYNSAIPFNPASVIKIGTSFAALYRWGADYRFETAFFTAGTINKNTKTLTGDLVLRSTGDPVLTQTDIVKLIQQVAKTGITQVTGDLIVTGPLTFDAYYTTDLALPRIAAVVRQGGIRVGGKTHLGPHGGKALASHESIKLRDILLDQNRRSSNPMAERLGEALGAKSGDGPKTVERFLVDVVGVKKEDVVVGRTSGLDYNRMTPRGVVQVLRQLVRWLDENHMQPADILPRAGEGTLKSRFTADEFREGVVGKTGTLPQTDGGVSTLAGILYTKDYGPVLFSIFNSKGTVDQFRRLQDNFLEDLIREAGGIASESTLSVSSHKSSN